MTFETFLCRDTYAVRLVFIRSQRFATPSLGAAISIAAVDRENARSHEGAAGEIIGEEKDWSGRAHGHSSRCDISAVKKAFAQVVGAFRRQSASGLEVRNV